MKKLFFFLCLPVFTSAQIKAGFQSNYSTKYNIGVGAEVGYLINLFYIGVDANVYIFDHKTDRDDPIFTSLVLGVKLNRIQPTISIGRATTGNESIAYNEGFSSWAFGGGVSYVLTDHLKIKVGIRQHQPNKIIDGEVVKNQSSVNGIASFIIGQF